MRQVGANARGCKADRQYPASAEFSGLQNGGGYCDETLLDPSEAKEVTDANVSVMP